MVRSNTYWHLQIKVRIQHQDIKCQHSLDLDVGITALHFGHHASVWFQRHS